MKSKFKRCRLLGYTMTMACLILMSTSVFGQATQDGIAIKGTVSGQEEPLIGVSVSVAGTTTGTITDIDGNFSLTVPSSSSTLVFSYLGYQGQRVTVGSQRNFTITLLEDTKALEEVVVIGYGQQRREAVTGSVASMQGNILREIPSANITQALYGRVAGVQMTQTNSKPGSEMQIRIRGTRSLTASNDPLVVLDGIPFAGTLGEIDPNSIKSVDILKDASATAIYGSRGANGVIIVTTKSGTRGSSAAKITYNGYYGFKNAIKVPMMTGQELTQLRKDANFTTMGLDEDVNVNTDWQDLLYQTGSVDSHDINIAGGSNTTVYNFGASYYKDQAVIPTQNYTRYSLRANVETEVAKYFRFGLVSNSNYNTTNGNQLGLYQALNATSISNPWNDDGTLKRTVRMAGDEQWVYTRESIEANKDTWTNQTRAFGSYNTLYGEVKAPWIEGLKYRVNVGLNFTTRTNGAFKGQGVNSSNLLDPSTASIDNRWTTNWAVENLLTYDRTFAEKHSINVVGLYSAEQTTYNRSNVSARNIPNEQFQYWNLGQSVSTDITVNPNNQDYWQSGLMSWMGRVMYSYDSRYMISATIRSDASSRLASGYQWHTYPAVSAGWNINRESFMSDISQINNLKLRVGYGHTSNQAVDPYRTLGLLATAPYNFDDTYTTGYYVSQLPNSKLGWEYSTTWNFGLDFTLFNNRLSGTVEYYSQKTSDVLQSVSLPITAGVGSYTANVGKTQNKGIELSLNGVILDNVNGFTWEAGVNVFANRNKLTELASGVMENRGNRWFVGHPINVIYDYKKIGLWQANDPYLGILEPGGNVGMIKVLYTGDFNDDGTPVRQIGSDDQQIMNMDPNWQGGFSTRLEYKGFDLNVVGSFQNGGVLVSTLYSGNGYLNLLYGRRNNVRVDYWTPDNTDANFPKPGGVSANDIPKYGTTMGYFDATYLKIATITLGYNFRSTVTKSLGVEGLRLYATVQNPFVFFSPFNKESGMDPEPNASGNDGTYTASTWLDSNNSALSRFSVLGTNTPNTRNYLFGLSLTF